MTMKFAATGTMQALIAAGTMACAAIATSGAASAQEFDCRKADVAAERTICQNDRLSGLDERMSRLYDQVLRASEGKKARAALKRYQRQFLAARDSCRHDTNCIKGAYLDQISVLEARLEDSVAYDQ